MFPIIPVAVTAGLGTLGYLLFKPDSQNQPSASAKGDAGTLGENSKPNLNNAIPGKIPPLKPAKRPADLPKGNVQPLPIPIPNVTPPAPSPSPSPAPLPLPIPIPTPVAPTGQTGVVIAPSGVNLRNAPNVNGSVLTGLTAGTRVKILSYNPTPTDKAPKGWYNVTAPNGMTGWATAEFINPDNGTNPNPVPVPIPIPTPNVVPNILPNILPSVGVTQGRILGSPGANLRAVPSTSGAIVKGLFNGTIVTVLSTALAPATAGAPKGWVNVKDGTGASGWVSREFCEPIAPASFGRDPLYKGSAIRG